MKRSIILTALLFGGPSVQAARTITIPIASETGLAYNANYDLDVTNYNLDSLSIQVVYSSNSFSTKTFTDGVASTGTITVVSTAAIHGLPGTDTLTVVSGKNGALASAKATDSLLVADASTAALNGSYLNVNGRKLYQNQQWFIGPTTMTTANSIANAISAWTNFTTSVDGSSVIVTCPSIGTSGNSYTLTSSTPTAMTVATAKFAGGQDSVYFTLNGYRKTNGIDWSTGKSSTNTAASIVTAAATVPGFTASASSNVVTVSCSSSGTYCTYGLSSSSAAALLAGAASFSGGVNPARLAVNGNVLTEGTDFTSATSTAATANAIAVAMNASVPISAIVTASGPVVCTLANPCGKVTLASKGVGTKTNYSLWSSANSSLTPFAVAMKGGANSAVVTGGSQLTITAHGFTKALPVLYTKTGGTSPGQLVANTTYYAIPNDANDIQLAAASADAVAGTPVVAITTQTATGGGSFALAPLAYLGTVTIKLQTSNDGVTFNDTPYAVTYSTNVARAASRSVTWNLGVPTFQTARVAVTGPTQGGINLTITGKGRTK